MCLSPSWYKAIKEDHQLQFELIICTAALNYRLELKASKLTIKLVAQALISGKNLAMVSQVHVEYVGYP